MKSALLTLLFGVSLGIADDIPGPLAEAGKLLFADDFERDELGASWKSVIPTFTIAKGVMRGNQTRADHGAVGRVSLPMRDVIVDFRFQLAGATVNAVFDDKTFKGSHAGHICRVAFTPRQIRLGDDKEGIMRNDIFTMRRNPARKAEADKLLDGRGQLVRRTLEQNRWYQARIEIVGDEMRVSLDGEAIGWLKSPGLAHPTKSSFHFTVSGKEAKFDDVKISEATKASGR